MLKHKNQKQLQKLLQLLYQLILQRHQLDLKPKVVRQLAHQRQRVYHLMTAMIVLLLQQLFLKVKLDLFNKVLSSPHKL